MKCPKCRTANPADSKFCKECATPLPLGAKDQISFTRTLETKADELIRGMLFAGRYEIIEELGAGGMGRVYRAHDTKLNEEVALKLIKPEIAADKKTVERFHNEIKIARKIRHKNVCGVYDFHEEGKALFLTMEYVRGEDLKSLIHRMKALTVGASLAIARQIAEGLGEAHKLGITHRDLKPGNVMIDKDGQAKVMDFGIARSLHGGGITAEGGIVGTPEYMSPEQVEGKESDPRADIYALGVILFEMVTGQVPFEGDTPFSIANKHKSEPPPIPKKLAPQIPEALNKLILRSLEKDKAKRYQTAEELLADLATIEATLPTAERVASRRKTITHREVTVKFQPRRLVVPIAIVLVLASAFLLWLFVFRPKPDGSQLASDRPSVAFLRVANKSGDKALDNWSENFPLMLSDNISQSRYIYVAPTDKVTSVLSRLKLLETSNYTTEDLREAGRLTGVKYLASGYFTRAGETFLVRLTVQEASSGKVVGTEEVRGEGQKSLIAMADELVRKLKPHLEVTAVEAANDLDGSLERAYTPSIEAYSYYLQGRKLFFEGKNDKAIEMFEKAVAIDPDFAMAYRALAGPYTNVSQTKWTQYLNKALEISQRSDRLPIREKLIIQGQSPTLGYAERTKALTELLRLYPEDGMGNGTMGNLCAELEEFDKAAEYYEVCIRQKPLSTAPYSNLFGVYVAQGEYEKAHKVLERALENFRDNRNAFIWIQQVIGYLFEMQGRFREALVQNEKAERLQPEPWGSYALTRASIHLYRDQFALAESEIRKLMEDKDTENQASGRYLLTALYLIQGKFHKAIPELRWRKEWEKGRQNPPGEAANLMGLVYDFDALGDLDSAERELSEGWDEALKTQYKTMAYYWRSVLLLKRKSYDEARKSASEFAALYEAEPNKKLMRCPLMLQGQIELENGSPAKAIELLSRAKSLERHIDWYGDFPTIRVPIMDLLGSAYFRAGDMEKARLEYEEISRMTWPRDRYGDKYAKSFYHLGQVYERLGKKSKAKENYSKFLDLWKDADPGLPEAKDAKARLEALK